MSDLSKPQQQFKIQKEIRKSEGFLVNWIQDALDDEKSYGKLEEAQFRNVVSVASSSESVEVIKNFLLYQVGRGDKWGKGKDSLAQKIIMDIETRIKERAKKIAEIAKTDDSNSILLELTRRYLGYGARYLTYKLNDKETRI